MAAYFDSTGRYRPDMRLLPCVRLSVLDNASTSPERQFEKIETYARLGGHELVPITAADYDLDVSGSVSPFARPGLGPWLRDDRLDMWDAIVVAKLDRFTRSLFDFVTLVSWLEARGKTLICIDPLLDLSTPAGAHLHRSRRPLPSSSARRSPPRVRDAWHMLRDSGKYGGGQVPFGYRPAKLDKGWGYEPDPVYGPIVAELYDRYSRCESLGSLVRWLNDTYRADAVECDAHPEWQAAKDALWKTTSLRRILASPASLGATVKTDGTKVRDEAGVVVYRADALIERDVWERVQARLATNPVAARVNSWLLPQIAFCGVCGSPMYGSSARSEDKTYTYYACVHSIHRDGICTARRVSADELVEKKVMAEPGFSGEINRVVEQMTHLYKEVQLGALAGEDISERQATLLRAEEKLARLHSLKAIDARVEAVATGHTLQQRWEMLDARGRNEFLRARGIRADVSRDQMPPLGLSARLAQQPSMAVIDQPGMKCVVRFGSLSDLLR
jgi:site-specific DNA recombinase